MTFFSSFKVTLFLTPYFYFHKLITKPQKTIFTSIEKFRLVVEKETSASKEETSSISYQKLVTRHSPGACSNTYNSIK